MTFLRSLHLTGFLFVLGACGGDRTEDAASDSPAGGVAQAGSDSIEESPSAPGSRVPAFVTDSAPRSDAPATNDSTGAIRSVYTSLAEAECRLVERDEETGATTMRCPGTAGYALLMHDFDARMTVDLIAPSGAMHRLRYSGVITSAFSSLGPRAEWRMRDGTPIALIIRVNAFENPDTPDRATSYLAVAKVTANAACVTDRIPPSANANELAQQAADQSASKPCMRDLAEQR